MSASLVSFCDPNEIQPGQARYLDALTCCQQGERHALRITRWPRFSNAFILTGLAHARPALCRGRSWLPPSPVTRI